MPKARLPPNGRLSVTPTVQVLGFRLLDYHPRHPLPYTPIQQRQLLYVVAIDRTNRDTGR
jgi:hypothetical protein